MVEEHDIEVEWKSFELRPEGVEMPPKPKDYIERAKAGVEALSQQYGIEMEWNDKSKHSRHALEGSKFAEDHGLSNEYHHAVFKAQFQHQKNINDIETLVEIVKDLGLDANECRKALETRRYEQRVLKDINEAKSIGVTGIPCFVSGNKGVMGVQTYESLLKLVEETE